MKTRHKLALLCVLLAVSTLPPLHFLIYEYPHSSGYIWQLLRGQATVGVNLATDRVGIVSLISYGFTDFSLSYMLLVVASSVAFCVCFVLILLVIYRIRR